MAASLVSRADAPPVLEPVEHVLDAMPLAVEDPGARYGNPTVSFKGDAGGDTWYGERASEPVGVISSVGEHGGGGRQSIDQQGGTLVIAGLFFG